MAIPHLVKLPKSADTKLITALAELKTVLEDPNIAGYICLITYKTDSGNDTTKYFTSSDSNFKDLYLNKIIEKYIMENIS